MLAMLQRLEQENQALDLDDDDHYESMLDRFSQIDIEHTDANVIWDLLSDQERKEFEHVLHNVEKTGDWHAWHLPSYSPWWEASSLIQEQDQSIPGPVLPASLPDFTRLTQPATRSSPHIVWNGLSILATYSYLMRHAMGDLLEDTRDTLCLCEVLSANVLFSNAATCPYEGVEDVVGDVVARIIDWEDKATTRPSFNHIRRYDLKLLLLHDLEVLQKESKRAIFDFWHTMDCISKQTRKKKVVLATKKLYFYFAAACYLDKQDMVQLAIQHETQKIEKEKQAFQRDFEAAKEAMKQYQKSNSTKIQILD
ncbi:uncharacterized protein B0P05DRAFT_580498 [Gilbertella persicaria]|uniref:uncharacterized protein n=1 Tax=Gilbertella persicaria TaxID=101096 RepID=UPI00222102AA|nr:uncharacterized protein B0P05DRAFT_580498 [Gilbertella persicaria]KAI8069749.1 hypothetical protein B0P05DRAFT_580498 [Gilbertella persicaria]